MIIILDTIELNLDGKKIETFLFLCQVSRDSWAV